ncbi:MAG TPA: hypothetical protein V6C81_22630 [Planktothrix sp.]
MEPNDQRAFNNYLLGAKLTEAEALLLLESLPDTEDPYDVPMKLIGFYSPKKHDSKANQKRYFDCILWLIRTVPGCTGYLAHTIEIAGCSCTPKQLSQARDIWYEHRQKYPEDATVYGNAGSFLIWKDFWLGERCLNSAMELDPTNELWPARLAVHYYSEFGTCLPSYKELYAKLAVKMCKLSLKMGSHAPWIDLIYGAECALFLEDFEQVSEFCDQLSAFKEPVFEQWANSYLGLIDIRKGNIADAVRKLTIMKKGYQFYPVIQLAYELLDDEQDQAVIAFINKCERKVKAKTRNLWIEQIERGIRPDFSQYCHGS